MVTVAKQDSSDMDDREIRVHLFHCANSVTESESQLLRSRLGAEQHSCNQRLWNSSGSLRYVLAHHRPRCGQRSDTKA